MNVLEKILEEIEERKNFHKRLKTYENKNGTIIERENHRAILAELDEIKTIIINHMNDVTDTNVGSKSGWIPCSERLPEDNRMVLVTCHTKRGIGGIYRAYYDGMFWHGSGFMPRVIAWQPLPEPYKGEEAAGECLQ